MAGDTSRPKLAVEIGLESATGARQANEDYAGCLGIVGRALPQGIAAVVADGVGGAKGGRVAAEVAVRGFLDAYASLDPMRGVQRNAIAGLEAMNGWLYAMGRDDPALAGMACTFTALVLRGRQAHVVHVGDSRLYRLRDGTLTQLTTDHVPTSNPMRNVLTRAVGAEAGVRIDYAVAATRLHDRYMLCSDGVHGGLSDRAIQAELGRHAAPQESAERLVQAALAARTGDNATALVIDVVGLPEANQFDLQTEVDALPILPTPRVGATVDGYRLDVLVSDGRYSRVFRATDEIEDRTVILKFPKPDPGGERVLRQAFLREAWIAARLATPFVAEVIEGPAERRKSLYTVMPFYRGETLEQRLRRPPRVSRIEGLSIATRLAKGVAALHRAQVIHRDIKPDNVLLLEDGGLRLIDLGVARLPNMEDFPAPDVPGTPSYMAPELIAGAPANACSDVYALGVTIYRMFTGAFPYGEIEPFSKPRFTRAPTPLSAHRPDLPAWLGQVLARAVAVRPADRYEDVVELTFALEHGALQAPVTPRRQSLLERDPLRFWQSVSLLLGLILLILLLRRHGGL